MRRTALYVAAWFAAGVAAVLMASAGVAMVGSQVTGSRPAPLSADQVRAELAEDESTTTTTGTSATTTSAPDTTDTPPSSAPGGAVTTSTTGPGPTGPTTTVPGTTPTTSAPSPTTTAPPAPATTRTYTLVGGTATLRFSAEGVTVVVASPNAGYSVRVEPTHDTGVRVEFRSDSHRSRVEGWWDGGPQDEVEEQD